MFIMQIWKVANLKVQRVRCLVDQMYKLSTDESMKLQIMTPVFPQVIIKHVICYCLICRKINVTLIL